MTKITKKGFTLIELLAVIVIITILFFIAVPVFNNVITRARYGAFGSSKKGIERASELYYVANADKIVWNNNISYIEIGELKSKKYLKKNVVNLLNNMSITDDTKILLYKKGRDINYSLQLYNDAFFSWYQEQMIKGSKKNKDNLPVNIGDKRTVELDTLMDNGLTDELRLPFELESRCVGYVEVEKISNKDYNYDAYIDCLTEASTFVSHYVSYGGKYLDGFNDVKETSDGGYIAVGESNSENYYGNINKGKNDGIIVKFSSNGTIEWSKNFGGSNHDYFYSVVENNGAYVVVGKTSSNDGDIDDYKGGSEDALIVKYDKVGNVIFKKSFGTSTGDYESFCNIVNTGTDYIIVGRLNTNPLDGDLLGVSIPKRSVDAIIIKMSENFDIIWVKGFGGSNYESLTNLKITSTSEYIVTGTAQSIDGDILNFKKTTTTDADAMILKYNSNGELMYKHFFGGSGNDYFSDLTEVKDGIIAVGYSNSVDYDMENVRKSLNNNLDGIIVKFDKTLSNVIWKKSFGGSNDDVFNGVLSINDSEIIVIGYSKSNDMDLLGLTETGEEYKNGILVKYKVADGTLTDKKIFGGSNSDIFNSIIKTNFNNYVIAGSTYSIDRNLKNFNKGHSDAILVSYNSSMILNKTFQEPVVLIDKLKKLIPNYGTAISTKYEKLYTSNNPNNDLLGWCSSSDVYKTGNTSNYYYGECLKSFNEDDSKLLVSRDVLNGLKIQKDEAEYKITINADNNYSWHHILVYNGGSTSDIELSNLKLKFEDNYVGHITDAINKGYIEPLVTVHSYSPISRPSALYPTVFEIINENGKTGIGNWPVLRINLKPKKSKLISIYLTSSRYVDNIYDGLSIWELRNFDMSITPTN